MDPISYYGINITKPNLALAICPKNYACHLCFVVFCYNLIDAEKNGRHFPYDIFKCIFLLKMYEFWLRFH